MAQNFYTYLAIAVVITFMFNVVGLPTMTGSIADQVGLGDLTNFKSGLFYLGIIGGLALLAGVVGIALSVFGKGSNTDLIVSAGLASGILIVFMGDAIKVFNYVSGTATGSFLWLSNVVGLIGIVFVVLYSITAYDWARGKE